MINLNKIAILFFILIALFVETGDRTVFANTHKTIPYFEDHSRRVGYKTVNEAVTEFEKHCNCEVKLPAMIPDILFTHEFGAFYKDEKHGKDDLLQIRFVNRELKNNIFKIDIRSNKVKYEGEKYTLQDGSEGVFFEHHIFNFFVIEKNNLQYIISIDKNVKGIDAPKVLLDVANSIK